MVSTSTIRIPKLKSSISITFTVNGMHPDLGFIIIIIFNY